MSLLVSPWSLQLPLVLQPITTTLYSQSPSLCLEYHFRGTVLDALPDVATTPSSLERLWRARKAKEVADIELQAAEEQVTLEQLDAQIQVLAELRSVAEWLEAEKLTDRVPALVRQAERLRMQGFAKILAHVVPEADDPLAPAAEPAAAGVDGEPGGGAERAVRAVPGGAGAGAG